jgi:hypothetical protein
MGCGTSKARHPSAQQAQSKAALNPASSSTPRQALGRMSLAPSSLQQEIAAVPIASSLSAGRKAARSSGGPPSPRRGPSHRSEAPTSTSEKAVIRPQSNVSPSAGQKAGCPLGGSSLSDRLPVYPPGALSITLGQHMAALSWASSFDLERELANQRLASSSSPGKRATSSPKRSSSRLSSWQKAALIPGAARPLEAVSSQRVRYVAEGCRCQGHMLDMARQCGARNCACEIGCFQQCRHCSKVHRSNAERLSSAEPGSAGRVVHNSSQASGNA